MDFLTWILAFSVASFAGTLASLLNEQAKSSAPLVASWFARRAAARLPGEIQLVCEEEWLAHLNQTPGPILKLVVAVGFWFALRGILREHRAEQAKRISPEGAVSDSTVESQVARNIANLLEQLPSDADRKYVVRLVRRVVEGGHDFSKLTEKERRRLLEAAADEIDAQQRHAKDVG